MSRILSEKYRSKIMSAEEAAKIIKHGDNVGFSGFTGSGYPKAVPGALAEQIKAAHERGEAFVINSYTGASTAPEHDGALAEVNGVGMRMPYQSDPIMRNKMTARPSTTTYTCPTSPVRCARASGASWTSPSSR